ncbi:spore cortex-lytic enzyme [Bacillus suaedae]|uniref:Spore cortex-lytic enzyme n=1 Tax=Halalkalibacter suaedae TaxID=2822140 RepID=A0A940WY27_9BACI|nr:spore cortex-lytic enzyme [Bacillus suaedae]MBP3950565.1 spore cortex-lytic enzyme [Bacillus suaedae]
MKHNLFSLKIPFIMVIICFGILSHSETTHAFSDQVIQKGATGDDVVELQSRLQYIGFYNGTIDGVFGWGTYWAVRNFQDEFGMTVDGLVGPQMKDRLNKTTNYNKEFVQNALEEGRKFTHYGTTPLEIQKGPKGSASGGQKKPANQGQANEQGQGNQQQEQANEQGQEGGNQGEEQQRGEGQANEQGQTTGDQTEQAEQQQQEQEDQAQGQAAEPNEADDQTAQPEQQPQPAEETPVEEPAPEPEQPEEQDNNADIQKATNVPAGYSDNDIQLMAQAVYGEARGESYVGQVAIAAVIINRINSPIFPNTVSGVIFEPRAFTAVADGQIYMTPNETARRAVLDALNGQDPTGNAIYYFNPDTATSAWIWSRPQIKRIGKHVFCH